MAISHFAFVVYCGGVSSVSSVAAVVVVTFWNAIKIFFNAVHSGLCFITFKLLQVIIKLQNERNNNNKKN